jgi:hypothetical protein
MASLRGSSDLGFSTSPDLVSFGSARKSSGKQAWNEIADGTRVILPKRNFKDVQADLPQSTRTQMSFAYVGTIEEALEEVWGRVRVSLRKWIVTKRIV